MSKLTIQQACVNATKVGDGSYLSVLKQHIRVSGDMILALTEIFQLIEKANEKKYQEVPFFDIEKTEFKRGVYFCEETSTGMALTDIPKGLFKYIAYDSAGSITKSATGSSLFDDEFGTYLIFFVLKKGFVHPNCYTYFIKSNNLKEITPFESFQISDEINAYWVEEAIDFINKNCKTNIIVQETEKIVKKV